MLAPFLVGILIFVALPALLSFGLAFTRYDGLSAPEWRGTLNFREIIADPLFATAARNSLVFILLAVPLRVLGALALATHAYTMQFLHVILIFGLAIAFAVEILVGHMIGAGELHAAHKLVRKSLGLGVVVALVVSGAFALAGPWLLTRFTADPQIIQLGCTLLWWTVLVEPGRVFNMVVINALRAAGDARYPVIAGAASMAIVLAGGSWFLGVHLGWGLVGVWIAYAADEWIRGLLMWRRWATLGWLPHARAAHRKLRLAKVG